ncbi:GntR family transcriptional regulator [Clostridium swellfunianum]|uniref:GntR family transcriptional regulator n=1 Tax=Clostridium swellfunianum TaxID=1367462 RepID=UPI00202E8114|nr:GntR family transcriptional regulator [Clostridium swellfunianum]MCM0647456.1 GntR family transcriptional regulator [Clostridium swellfunianum]
MSEHMESKTNTPLYHKIQNYILELIKANKLKEGDLIPTEVELSNMFNMSRPTVRQGLNTLVSQGYLRRIKGKGTFVTKPKILQENTRFIESYNREMSNKGLIPETKVLEISIKICPDSLVNKLGIEEGAKVIKLTRLRYAYIGENEDKKPILLTTVYIPYSKIPNLIMYDFEKRSLYEVFEENNIYTKKVVREIEAKLSDKETSRLLKINDGSPIHLLSSYGYLEDGSIIEYSESIYPGERNKFIVEITR